MDTGPFWAASRERRLLLQYCQQSGRYQAYPRPGSVFTGRRQLGWRQAVGRGRLVTWTIDRVSPPAPGAAPRVHALVDLEEGVRLLTWLEACEPAALRAGMPLKLHWVALADGLNWPAFEPDTTGVRDD
jgi:uncharacterized OB-fold protein